MLSLLPFAFGLVCAGLMGFAIQRGGTCLVAALDEIVSARRADKLLAIFEAGLWVVGGLAIAHLAGARVMPPANWLITANTVLGGLILGIGALVNRACAFGSIARLGAGDWAYMFTPAGFYVGCLAARPVLGSPLAGSPHMSRPSVEWLIVLLLFSLVLWRARKAIIGAKDGHTTPHILTQYQSTIVIGIAYLALSLAVGKWAYTDVLAELAQGMSPDTLTRVLLFAALLRGALKGGSASGRLTLVRPSLASMLRCLTGGALMGCGSLLVPGGNDGLLLTGLPLLQPYALVALASMAAAIICGMEVERRIKTW